MLLNKSKSKRPSQKPGKPTMKCPPKQVMCDGFLKCPGSGCEIAFMLRAYVCASVVEKLYITFRESVRVIECMGVCGVCVWFSISSVRACFRLYFQFKSRSCLVYVFVCV